MTDMTDQILKMIPYNTGMEKLRIPEYGRNIQMMVDHCLTIEDREERTRCAHRIVETMAVLFPTMVGEGGDTHKFWDHLNIMSGFRLDIDFPYDVVKEEDVHPMPGTIPYGHQIRVRRHYGNNIQQMIDIVADMEEGDEKEDLIYLLATQMKKLLMIHIREGVTTRRVIEDLAVMSGGRIILDPSYVLPEFAEVQQPALSKKKKKKQLQQFL